MLIDYATWTHVCCLVWVKLNYVHFVPNAILVVGPGSLMYKNGGLQCIHWKLNRNSEKPVNHTPVQRTLKIMCWPKMRPASLQKRFGWLFMRSTT